jgi:hypothetical protein
LIPHQQIPFAHFVPVDPFAIMATSENTALKPASSEHVIPEMSVRSVLGELTLADGTSIATLVHWHDEDMIDATWVSTLHVMPNCGQYVELFRRQKSHMPFLYKTHTFKQVFDDENNGTSRELKVHVSIHYIMSGSMSDDASGWSRFSEWPISMWLAKQKMELSAITSLVLSTDEGALLLDETGLRQSISSSMSDIGEYVTRKRFGADGIQHMEPGSVGLIPTVKYSALSSAALLASIQPHRKKSYSTTVSRCASELGHTHLDESMLPSIIEMKENAIASSEDAAKLDEAPLATATADEENTDNRAADDVSMVDWGMSTAEQPSQQDEKKQESTRKRSVSRQRECIR